ncbi:hypothetical protein LTR86_005472 [Recurvomyces mirabilis]|nr:hypothetical protein LTR86_005472 [Recurvomyces mirabilis]
MVKCDSCGSEADKAKDSNMAHCATCNNIIEIKEQPKEESKPAETKQDVNKEEVKKS